MDIILILEMLEIMDMVVIKEILEVLEPMEEICLVLISSKEDTLVIIKEIEGTGIRILEDMATSVISHLEMSNLNGMPLNLLVKFVSKQVTLLIFARNLRSSLLQVLISHHQIGILSQPI